jgi:phosphatidate phosphatase APP1
LKRQVGALDLLLLIKNNNMPNLAKAHVKIYHGYGHTHNLVVYGHVLKTKQVAPQIFSSNIFYNMLQLLRLFFVKPIPGAKVKLQWQQQQVETVTEYDGFFKFEWVATKNIAAGWHQFIIEVVNEKEEVVSNASGEIFVPHKTQYGFISDIDDTVMVSHSATILRRLKELFMKNARTRAIFPDVAKHYSLLSHANTNADTPNPFFYVSSSEWNLYNYLSEFFNYNGLPKGAFLLNQIKKWFELWKTGKTKHEGKLLRVIRILDTFPEQQFVLLGDNTQSDPAIYAQVVKKYPGKIFAVYIRNVVHQKENATRQILEEVSKAGVHIFLFKHSEQAIEHSKFIGLIQ